MLTNEDRARLEAIRAVEEAYPSDSDRAWLLSLVDRLTQRRVPQSDDEAFLAQMRGLIWEWGGTFRQVTHSELKRLLAMLDASDDILCDYLTDHHQLRQEGGAEERERIRDIIYRNACLPGRSPLWSVDDLDEELASLPPLPPPSPPSASRKHADEAVALLRRWLEWYEGPTEGIPYATMAADTRRLLSEEGAA